MEVKPWDLRPGDIGFGPIHGWVGLLVGFGQAILGDDSRYRHVVVVVSTVPGGSEYGPMIVEAMPTGARYVDARARWLERYVFIRPAYADLTQGHRVAQHAMAMVATPYGFSDYVALALKHLGIRSRLLDWWISRVDEHGYPRRAICSQLADQAMTKAGYCVFNDGRLSQDVIPGALFYQLLRQGGQQLWPI